MSKTYVVKSGDTLSKIARETLGDAQRWEEIYEANKTVIDDPNLLQPGLVLKIPGAGSGGRAQRRRNFV